jgi:cobalt-zinc-cadmium efflux system membrane fusion protein
VASVTIDTGAAVGNGIAPFVVENTANLRLDLQVPERLAGLVRAGMTVTVIRMGEPRKAPFCRSPNRWIR